MKKTLKVDAIRNGTVIDHIPSGKGLRVLEILESQEVSKRAVITIGLNLPSQTFGKKDILKIEKLELTDHEVNQIALIAPVATLSIIRDFEVAKKMKVEIPEYIEGLMKCPNPNCVTSDQTIKARMRRVSKEPVRLRCTYCERVFNAEEIKPIRVNNR